MKRLLKLGLMALLALGVGQMAHAQCGANNMPLNEVGVRLVSLTNASNFGGIHVAEQSLGLGFFNGINYKRYGSYGAFRTSLALTRYEYEARRNCPECLRTDGKVSGITARVGYEWYAIMGPFEPYAGFDVVGVVGKYEGETWNNSTTNYIESHDTRSRRGMGISPVVGLRCYLGYAVSVSAETCLDMMFLGRTTRITYVSPEATDYIRSNNYFETIYQPLNNVSLNVMF